MVADGSPRPYHPPLRWVPSAPVRGRAGEACDPGAVLDAYDVPRACVPPLPPDEQRAQDERRHVEDIAGAMSTSVTLLEALCLALARGAGERERGEDARAAALEALRACVDDDYRVAVALLERVVGEVVRFEDACAAGSPGSAVRRMRTVAQRMIARAKP